MKNNLTGFLLGIMCMLFIAASIDNTQIFQPKKPAITEVRRFDCVNHNYDIDTFINTRISQGYILKSVSIAASGSCYYGFVIVEKY